MPITVSDLAIAPVKGLRLAQADELEIGESGAVGDRAFVVVDENDGALMQTARTPTLVQVAQRWDPGSRELTLRFPDGAEVGGVPTPGKPVSTGLYDGRRVDGRLASGPHSEALSAHLGRPVRLLMLDRDEVGADDYPVTLMSSASVAALGGAMPGGIPDPRRFRMTITAGGRRRRGGTPGPLRRDVRGGRRPEGLTAASRRGWARSRRPRWTRLGVVSMPLTKARTLRPVICSTASTKSRSAACWKNILISRTR